MARLAAHGQQGRFLHRYHSCYLFLTADNPVKRRILIVLVLISGVFFSACDRDQPPLPGFEAIKTPQSFNWNSISNVIVNVSVNEGFNGLVMDLLDDQGRRIDRTIIVENRARFNVRISTEILQLTIYSPLNDDSITIAAVNTTEYITLPASARDLWDAAADADNDGIPDEYDAYPQDSTLAFVTRVPYVGEHYQLYDDAWPVRGDNDYNDLAFSTVFELKYSPTRRLLAGDVRFRLLAASQQFDYGLGMEMLTFVAGNTFAYPFGTAVQFSGVPVDDSVNNCAILFNRLADIQPTPYNNDGVGPSATPAELAFSFTWNSTVGGDLFWPNFFLFRGNDRRHEVHCFGYPPTLMNNTNLLGTGDDVSIRNWVWTGNFAMPNAFYRSYRNFPWGLEFFDDNFFTVREGEDLAKAYPALVRWAETAGVENVSWRNFPDTRLIFPTPN